MSSSIDITVTLTDVNDNNPDFGLGPFTASVPEVCLGANYADKQLFY